MDEQLLANKVAIVTGASRGIGRAIALDLARNGASVVVNYNSSPDPAGELVAEIQAAGGQAVAIQADVSDFAAAQALIKATLDAYGQIDILVNNAGTTRDMLLMMMKEDDWDTVIDTNLKSVYNCCKAAVRPMLRRKKGGRIINITSIVGLVGQGGQTNYAASKAGIIGFSKSLAKEVGPRQITVNAVAPGFFPTALTAVLSDEMVQKALAYIPLGRLGELDEVAHLVTFLASDRAAYITGEVIRIDGGMAM
ncbi:MAG: 3-oxoacyl-[acyl-carrier-protein] reductase [Ardenticatenaceae bacterium]|nr:3-oxoacyl-[acyl-carrier-protein] reductase [Anaerolineales bacterium]MCB8917297.1 3-oxoacyl-[acyl-carrier-protein] reductase [Ardenticatenaceae bacterium]